ncbi:MAG: hypothetical protein IPL61_33725 [Myxococcales bacterium]|nr:hypothetical protein [Myxococcales bacterium]
MTSRMITALLLACSLGLGGCVEVDPAEAGLDPDAIAEPVLDEVLDNSELPAPTRPSQELPQDPGPGDVLDLEQLPDAPSTRDDLPIEPVPGDVLDIGAVLTNPSARPGR